MNIIRLISLRKISLTAWNRIKEDTREIINKIKIPKQTRKKINIWIYLFLAIVCAIVVLLMFPLFTGMISIIFPSDSSGTIAAPSSQAIMTFILLATALGTLIVWFAERRGRSEKERERTRLIKLLGKQFLLSAMALTLFLLLSPIIPEIRDGKDIYSNLLKYLSAISFMSGSILFAGSVIESFFEIPRM